MIAERGEVRVVNIKQITRYSGSGRGVSYVVGGGGGFSIAENLIVQSEL